MKPGRDRRRRFFERLHLRIENDLKSGQMESNRVVNVFGQDFFMERPEPFEDFPAKEPVSTAEVGEPSIPIGPGNPEAFDDIPLEGHHFRQEILAAIDRPAPAANATGRRRLQMCDGTANQIGHKRMVGVEDSDDLSRGELQGIVGRGGLAAVCGETADHFDAGIQGGESADDLFGPVGTRRFVEINEFELFGGIVEGQNRGDRTGQDALFVEGRDDDRDGGQVIRQRRKGKRGHHRKYGLEPCAEGKQDNEEKDDRAEDRRPNGKPEDGQQDSQQINDRTGAIQADISTLDGFGRFDLHETPRKPIIPSTSRNSHKPSDRPNSRGLSFESRSIQKFLRQGRGDEVDRGLDAAEVQHQHGVGEGLVAGGPLQRHDDFSG